MSCSESGVSEVYLVVQHIIEANLASEGKGDWNKINQSKKGNQDPVHCPAYSSDESQMLSDARHPTPAHTVTVKI